MSSFFFQYYVMCMNHNLFNQSPVDGHADCFNSFAISNKSNRDNPVFKMWLIWTQASLGWCTKKAEPVQSPQVPPLCSETWHPWLTGSKISHVCPNTPWWKQIISGAPGMHHHRPQSEEVAGLRKVQPNQLREWLQGTPKPVQLRQA